MSQQRARRPGAERRASARRIHAVMVTPSASGGHPRYTWELMTALRALAPPRELALTLLTSADLDPEFRRATYDIACVLPPLRDARTFRSRIEWAVARTIHYARREEALLRWVRTRGDVDVLHYQEPPFAAPLHLGRARAAGVSPVATIHNLRPHRYLVPAVRRLSDASSRVAWKQCATLFVHSAGLKDQLVRELGSRAPPVVAIPHGVWTGHGARGPAPRRDGYLLLFGVMRRNKGLHLMLDALAHLPGKRLVLAGAFEDPSFAREIRHRIEGERLPVDVRDGVVPEEEIAALYSGAALAVLPYTEFHAQSGVLHLAIACGVPAVVTDVGALGEQVRREGIGGVAPPHDPGALARAVDAALEASSWEAARARCLTLAATLSWSAAAALTLDAYRRVCAVREEDRLDA
jgi:glycosyltransferase involved in cell wall biosynthesis